ncbi:MAG TPA: molybdopterin molybdotransferase MoeA [Candidatus Binataceae bacterium]|nr:molybdopterin molybdotransferase MoeA [Candidatus Binataceae bacterium]
MNAIHAGRQSEMISVNDALARYRVETRALAPQEIALVTALGRTLAAEARATTDLPPFAQSAMDGYALRAADTSDAAPGHPAKLRVAGDTPAGPVRALQSLGRGEAIRVFTGSHMPLGSDAVLRQEDVSVRDGILLVTQPCRAGKDFRQRGEEIHSGELLARSGVRLTPAYVAALSAAAVARVSVRRAPRISVVVTGDEVVEAGCSRERGEIPDANAPMIAGWLQYHGYDDVEVTHVADDLRHTVQVLGSALERSDLVISTGGISSGDRDYIARAASELGVRRVFHGVRQRPGKPLFFGVSRRTPFIGLPGNPGAMFVGLVVHVRAILDTLEGVAPPGPGFWRGRLAQAVPMACDDERWLRCGLDVSATGEVVLVPQDNQASHMITNLGECAALVRIPAGVGSVAKNSVVEWTPVDGPIGSRAGIGPETRTGVARRNVLPFMVIRQ